MGTAKAELTRLLYEDALRDCILIVMANKQDVDGAMSCAEIAEQLGLSTTFEKKWFVQSCSALTGDGLFAAMDWLTASLQPAKNSSQLCHVCVKLFRPSVRPSVRPSRDG